jgi:hypothetical protein
MFRLGPKTEIAFTLLSTCAVVTAAAFTTKLQANTIRAWDHYIAQFEQRNPVDLPLNPGGYDPVLTDLNPDGTNNGADVPGGYIHHWMGVMRLPGVPASRVVSTIEDYPGWWRIYAPDVKLAVAKPMPVAEGRGYDLQLVSEQVDSLMHFAFDARFYVHFRQVGDWTLVNSPSYQIRESNSGHAPYTDLLREGNDHGIAWRLNTYWRIRDVDGAAYAECQVISLSRKPLFGTTGHIKVRARESLESTMRHTRDWIARN